MQTMQREKVDERGYLRVPERWSLEIAQTLAEAEGIELTAIHWRVIRTIRDFFGETDVAPSHHVLRERLEDINKPFKYNCVLAMKQLFPRGGIEQACRIAGLPDYYHGC